MKSHLPESSRPTITWDPHDPAQPAARANGKPEPRRAQCALRDYLNLGPGRTIAILFRRYQSHFSPPTRSIKSLRKWSSIYDWPQRAAAFDEIEGRQFDAKYGAQRNEILQRAIALENERIEILNSLYQKVSSLIESEDALWTKEVKSIHIHPGQAERYESRRFNAEMVQSIRNLLKDIAIETGGRTPRRAAAPARPYPLQAPVTLDILTPEERHKYMLLLRKVFSDQVKKSFSTENDEKSSPNI